MVIMHKKFDSTAIEKKWQTKWQESKIYNVGEVITNNREYVLVEWPYPSGNLHIGHWYAFAVPDIYVRYRRMSGVTVLYPMGFDAFGLPAENAAIKRSLSPKNWTDQNISYMREQLNSMGNAFSWDKTCNSTDPEYYKWTQWMFTEFFRNNIAYRGKGVVNWCPGCNTVIANEQVLTDGTCERSGDLIEKREMPQWMLRITQYADRLIDDLETLDWPEHIKEAQRQWIGRSRGAEIDFTLSTGEKIAVFTTRPDTLFGATYLVLAPEHPLVVKSKNHINNWAEVNAYVETVRQKDEQERLDNTKEKTGVKIAGITALNPATNENIPVFIADYVLGAYGTGAIMAVPAHDERDYAFAKKFSLPVKAVVASSEALPTTTAGHLINSGEFDGLTSDEAKTAIVAKVGGRLCNTYRLRDWSIGRQRYWGVPIPIVYDSTGKPHPVPKEHLPWLLPEDVDPKPTGEAPLAKSTVLKERTEAIFGAGWTPEVETMDTFVDSSWYFMRYVDNRNDTELANLEIQKNWLPVDLYFGGAEHTTMHLLYSRFWQKALFDLGLAAHSEPYKKRINRGLILGPDGNKMSKSKGNVIDPDEQVRTLGADTVKMYLAFLGPYEGSNYPFDLSGIAGIRRFLERVYGLSEHLAETETEEITRQLHKTIAKVRTDIESFKFNTAISAFMIFLNQAEKAGLTKESYLIFLRLLAPFAPHLTEEIWSQLGEVDSIHQATYPQAKAQWLEADTVVISVQVNGKLRGTITLPVQAKEAEAMAAARQSADLQKYFANQEITKVIFVPKKILSIITTQLPI